MKILFAYRGRYHVREAVTLEYLSAIARARGCSTGLVYDPDIFGVTDNLFCLPALNAVFSAFGRQREQIAREKPRFVVFLDTMNSRSWNGRLSDAAGRAGIRTAVITLDGRGPEGRYDHTLSGEPESVFPEFIETALRGKEPAPVVRSRQLAALDALPLPDKELFAPYVNFGGSYMLYTSKGCRFRCSYCEETVYRDLFGDGYVRRRSPENVIAELEQAGRRFAVREVIFKDSVFAADKDWLKRFLGLYRQNVAVPYKCFGKSETFDDETAALLKESGCYCVEFGMQTANEQLRNGVLERAETGRQLKAAFGRCARIGLAYDIDHMFGLPGESVADHKEAVSLYASLEGLNRVKCHNLVYYRPAGMFKHAPADVQEAADYRADFFSSVAGSPEMKAANAAFQKWFKVLPLLPPRTNGMLLNGERWKWFRYLPSFAVVLLQLLIALRNRDIRFSVYLRHYPLKVRWALSGARHE